MGCENISSYLWLQKIVMISFSPSVSCCKITDTYHVDWAHKVTTKCHIYFAFQACDTHLLSYLLVLEVIHTSFLIPAQGDKNFGLRPSLNESVYLKSSLCGVLEKWEIV